MNRLGSQSRKDWQEGDVEKAGNEMETWMESLKWVTRRDGKFPEEREKRRETLQSFQQKNNWGSTQIKTKTPTWMSAGIRSGAASSHGDGWQEEEIISAKPVSPIISAICFQISHNIFTGYLEMISSY